jgi:hypothetical protein
MYIVTVYVEGGALDGETLACGPYDDHAKADEAMGEVMDGLGNVGLGGQVALIEPDRHADELLRRVAVTGESASG